MSTPPYILDGALPVNQDYQALKDEGLAYIQQHSGQQWTNLNTADPGVTILDQVCYALTELGYCNDFPIADILTGQDGDLKVEDQFYLPEEILTTSPVTIDDYRKCLIDGIEGIRNAVILPVKDQVKGKNGTYQVYLFIDTAITDNTVKDLICKAAYVYLNKCRNLGELFLKPLCLSDHVHLITGRIEISEETQLNTILTQIQASVQHYLFPEVLAKGYDELTVSGMAADGIFNGPILQNGWISTEDLGKKRDQLRIIDLQQLIGAVKGVIAVSDLVADNLPLYEEMTAPADQMLTIDWVSSLQNGLDIYCKGRKLAVNPNAQSISRNSSKVTDHNLVFGAAVNSQTELPKGKFRDINTYFSIQHTFPEIFAVGADATTANATPFQIAQSRQLKGYLTLFDQVLANQFAQLANVGQLFSFKNAVSGAPSDREEFYALKTAYEKSHPEYPVPYLTFSPTYFYQSLYTVPHIRPLLKNNDTFKFSTRLETEKELENRSLLPSILVSFAQSRYCGGSTEIISRIVVFSEAALISRSYPSLRMLTKPVNFKGRSLIFSSFFLSTKVRALVLILVIRSACRDFCLA